MANKIEEISLADIKGDNDTKSQPRIENVSYVASYNWIDKDTPTISVPGLPPKWQPSSKTKQLQPDSGTYISDPNGARFPIHPTEPAVRAILHENPTFDTTNVNIFACGNTLDSLLEFVQDSPRTFQLGVERIGNTVFLIREPPPETVNSIVSKYSYSRAFHDTYTKWEAEAKESVSHQRIVRYDFMGLKLVVRHACDGYLPNKVPKERELPPRKRRADEMSKDDAEVVEEEGVQSIVSCANVVDENIKKEDEGPASTTALPQNATLTLTESGRNIPQAAIFDIRTRSTKFLKQKD